MNLDLFSNSCLGQDRDELSAGATVLRQFAAAKGPALLDSIARIASQAPFRHMETPGGFRMSVAMTNCGPRGWVTDRRGYRYTTIDPEQGVEWPPLPKSFSDLAQSAAAAAGFPSFAPDACLVNRYESGARMSLHQDRNESDFSQPIVSVSLGLPAVFLFGGDQRSDRPQRIALTHGDVVVWGGPSRLRFHGITPLKPGNHPLTGSYRYNLTFRRAG